MLIIGIMVNKMWLSQGVEKNAETDVVINISYEYSRKMGFSYKGKDEKY